MKPTRITRRAAASLALPVKLRRARKPLPMVKMTHRINDDRSLVVVLPVRTESEANTRDHWAVRNKRKLVQRDFVLAMLINARTFRYLPDFPVTVNLTRIGPNRLDDDNLRSAFKSGVRDTIAKFYGVDDGDPRWNWTYEQETQRAYGVRIEITPA